MPTTPVIIKAKDTRLFVKSPSTGEFEPLEISPLPIPGDPTALCPIHVTLNFNTCRPKQKYMTFVAPNGDIIYEHLMESRDFGITWTPVEEDESE